MVWAWRALGRRGWLRIQCGAVGTGLKAPCQIDAAQQNFASRASRDVPISSLAHHEIAARCGGGADSERINMKPNKM